MPLFPHFIKFVLFKLVFFFLCILSRFLLSFLFTVFGHKFQSWNMFLLFFFHLYFDYKYNSNSTENLKDKVDPKIEI